MNSSIDKDMSGLLLRKTVSDVTGEMNKLGKELETNVELDDELLQAAECECCGLKEECTKEYITNIRNSHSGKWVCGLCSEVVKERLKHEPIITIEEAVSTHRNFCQEFNSTTRLNPKLSLACAMRNIAKKSGEKRRNNSSSSKMITRSSSCVPRIDYNMK
ncbi:unnamed protein product [Fraxinus pennsylvanica]|uniref:Uncharacterized protein n=1 Tax=Fraxinus pennsylvanica TaxID=56036 RepID=A0AAD1ZR61_9LAMI|nr:unnamed protein product [Fraxinus pennsylvanica]